VAGGGGGAHARRQRRLGARLSARRAGREMDASGPRLAAPERAAEARRQWQPGEPQRAVTAQPLDQPARGRAHRDPPSTGLRARQCGTDCIAHWHRDQSRGVELHGDRRRDRLARIAALDGVGARDLRDPRAHCAQDRLALRIRAVGRLRGCARPRRADGRDRGSVDGLLPLVVRSDGAGPCSVERRWRSIREWTSGTFT
jgi:hypothetical protein